MTFAWETLAPGLFLLLFPTIGMLSRQVQLRTWESFQSLHSVKTRKPWWWVAALWIDPVRAMLGVYLLRGSLGLEVVYWSQVSQMEYGVFVGAMLIGVMAQLYSQREEGGMLAPLGYVVGMVALLVPWPVGIAGLVMAITSVFAFRQFGAFFMGGLLGVALLGALLRIELVWLLPAVGVCAVPLIANLVTGRTMELPTRDPS